MFLLFAVPYSLRLHVSVPLSSSILLQPSGSMPSILLKHTLTLFTATSNSLFLSRLRGFYPTHVMSCRLPHLCSHPLPLSPFSNPDLVNPLCAVPHQYANSQTPPSPTTHPTRPLSLPCVRAPSTVVVVEPLDPSFYTFV